MLRRGVEVGVEGRMNWVLREGEMGVEGGGEMGVEGGMKSVLNGGEMGFERG